MAAGGYRAPLGESPFPSYQFPSKVLGAKAGDTSILAQSALGEQGPSWGHPEVNSSQCHLLPGTTPPSQLFEEIFQYLNKFAISQGAGRSPKYPKESQANN